MINEMSSRPRGRPRAFDREVALGQARRAFWQLGYEGASIADLTAAMGITPQSLYAAFQSKAALYRETLEQYRRTDGSFTRQALTEEPTAAKAFRRILTAAAHLFTSPDRPTGCMLSTAITTCAVENKAIADLVTEMRQDALARYRERVEKGIRDGDVPPEIDALAIARFFQTVLQGMTIQARDGACESDLATIAAIAWPELEKRLTADPA